MNVSLTPELENYVRRKVASGLYNNASELIREALRLLVAREGPSVGEPAPPSVSKDDAELSTRGVRERPSEFQDELVRAACD